MSKDWTKIRYCEIFHYSWVRYCGIRLYELSYRRFRASWRVSRGQKRRPAGFWLWPWPLCLRVSAGGSEASARHWKQVLTPIVIHWLRHIPAASLSPSSKAWTAQVLIYLSLATHRWLMDSLERKRRVSWWTIHGQRRDMKWVWNGFFFTLSLYTGKSIVDSFSLQEEECFEMHYHPLGLF